MDWMDPANAHAIVTLEASRGGVDMRLVAGQFVMLDPGDGRCPRIAELSLDLGYAVLAWVFGAAQRKWDRMREYPRAYVVSVLNPERPRDEGLIAMARKVPRESGT